MKRKRERRQSLDMATKNGEKGKRGLKRKKASRKSKSLWESIKECKDQDEVQSQAWAR